MNEKYFDLKKEKQDRIINAALAVFAAGGYEHASTDDIVRKAGISKGLLFHYFISKLGLYTFLYDYSVKYVTLEIKSSVTAEKQDYFALRKLMAFAKMQVMKNYPDMLLFIDTASRERDPEAASAAASAKLRYEEGIERLYEQSDRTVFADQKVYMNVDRMLTYTELGLAREHFEDGSLQPEMLFTEINGMIEQMRRLVAG